MKKLIIITSLVAVVFVAVYLTFFSLSSEDLICEQYQSTDEIQKTNINGVNYIIIGEGSRSLTISEEFINKYCDSK